MDADQAKALRAAFPKEAIGQKPQPYRKDSPKEHCNVCNQKHGVPAMHLDYVGHAATTDRLLQVDPEWTWEPFSTDQQGLPALDRDGNLWIRLTVAGVTRPGVGDGANMKERIGDAIRNAAMRFGVALDLWAKEDLKAPDEPEPPAPQPAPAVASRTHEEAAIRDALRELEPADRSAIVQGFRREFGGMLVDLAVEQHERALAWVEGQIARQRLAAQGIQTEEPAHPAD
jgi:hypothetical protein